MLSFWKLFVVVKCYLSHYLVFLDAERDAVISILQVFRAHKELSFRPSRSHKHIRSLRS